MIGSITKLTKFGRAYSFQINKSIGLKKTVLSLKNCVGLVINFKDFHSRFNFIVFRYAVRVNNSYLVSILLPCHSLKYLRDAVESISNQTLPIANFELLIVGDRIDLNLAKDIVTQYSLNYRIIESPTPGIVPALNLGLANIKSKYVARMDDDDIMISDRLEKQLDFLEKNKKYVVVGGQIELINEAGDRIGRMNYVNEVRNNLNDLRMSCPLAHPATMFIREKVIQIGGYRDFLPEDWDLWVRLRSLGSLANLNDVVLKYRVHASQLSKSEMYKLAEARTYINTSFFARELGYRDHPQGVETRKEWLDATRSFLKVNSKNYRKVEKQIENSFAFESAFEMLKNDLTLRSTIVFVVQNPLRVIKKLFRKILKGLT